MREEIEKAVAALKKGGVILYPTDTVWGIGCDATNAEAVERIYRLKKSTDKKGMIVLTASADDAGRYVGRVPQVAWEIMDISDKPLTLILPNGCGVAENLIADDGSLALRIPDHPFCHALLKRFGRPLVSTSANISGEKTPLYFSDIAPEIKEGVDLCIDPVYEKDSTRKPSSIIRLGESGQVEIIRE